MRTVIRRLSAALAVLVLVGTAATAVSAWHAGYRIYVVHTGSMAPTLKPGDAVLDRPASPSVKAGEIVTFAVRSGPDSVVTHRVASVDGTVVKTKGDANRSVDPWSLQVSQIVGSAVTRLPFAGYVLVYLRQPQGAASMLTIVIGLILLWRLFFPANPDAAPSPAAGDPVTSHRPRHKANLRLRRRRPLPAVITSSRVSVPAAPPAPVLERYQAAAAMLRHGS